MNQVIKEYIISKKNKVTEKEVLFEDFLEYVKVFEWNGPNIDPGRKYVGSVVHEEMLKDV